MSDSTPREIRLTPEFQRRLKKLAKKYSQVRVEAGAVDGQKLNDWLSELLQTQGPNVFRMKGILHVYGVDQWFVFQGVHMLFEGRADRPWKPNEPRKNELVFIGRNLNEAELREGFRACLV